MLSRFLQLFLLCSLILLIPSLIYLSSSSTPSVLDSGHLYAPGSILKNGQVAGNQSPQLNQGHGEEPDSNLDTSNVPHDWNWPDYLMNPVHKAEDYWKNFNKAGKTEDTKKEQWDDEQKKAQDKLLVAAQSGSSTMLSDGKDGAIMGKMKNETAKAELGRATWKFLHTMTLRYPENPTPSDREALFNFMHLFSRLYPCGECASHFQALLKDYPPQTSSRNAAAGWLCAAHNRVNDRLKKPKFPCDKLDENYDCGCGDEKNSITTAKEPLGPQNEKFIPSEIKTALESTEITSKMLGQNLPDLTPQNWVSPPLPVLSKRDSFMEHLSHFEKRQESCQCRSTL